MTATSPLPPPDPGQCLGVFDSGLGGLSIVRELRTLLPRERIVYCADTLHMPYGPRPLQEVRRYSLAIADMLLRLPAKIVVLACNTASAAALEVLRRTYPGRLFVGMEPAVKPAAGGSRCGRVGVMATQATFQGELFASVVERFAAGVEVVCQPCPGLAEAIENYPPESQEILRMVEHFVLPLTEKGVDQLVLGCTHYPLVKEVIARVAGRRVTIVDPSPAVARRVAHVLAERGLAAEGPGGLEIMASGETEAFGWKASSILGREVAVERFRI